MATSKVTFEAENTVEAADTERDRLSDSPASDGGHLPSRQYPLQPEHDFHNARISRKGSLESTIYDFPQGSPSGTHSAKPSYRSGRLEEGQVRRGEGSAQSSLRVNNYFIPGEGINQEVILADIGNYFGEEARVRPGEHSGRTGYLITAHCAPTRAMIARLVKDSHRFELIVKGREGRQEQTRSDGETSNIRTLSPSTPLRADLTAFKRPD